MEVSLSLLVAQSWHNRIEARLYPPPIVLALGRLFPERDLGRFRSETLGPAALRERTLHGIRNDFFALFPRKEQGSAVRVSPKVAPIGLAYIAHPKVRN